MKMTLFVDSSYCDRTGAGGWGAWAIRDDWQRGQFSGGPIRLQDNRLSSSTTAEIAGIALALWQLKAGGALDGLTEIMIQCDNVPALTYIWRKVPGTKLAVGPNREKLKHNHRIRSPVVEKIMVTVAEMLEGKRIQVKHVKGHQNPSKDGRAWVNHQCDREADRHMKALRKEIDDLERYGYSRPQLPPEK